MKARHARRIRAAFELANITSWQLRHNDAGWREIQHHLARPFGKLAQRAYEHEWRRIEARS